MFYDYVDSGSWSESTYHANYDDFVNIKLHSRVARNIEMRSLRTTMVGQEIAMPVALAPTGLAGLIHADGEILAAKAAEDFGVPFTLSTMSICSIEEVAKHTKKPFWFQLYILKDREFTMRLMERAKEVKCPALVVTLDLPIMGQRNKDLKNGLTAPVIFSARNVFNVISKARWTAGMLRTKNRNFGNIVGHVSNVSDASSLMNWTGKQFDQTISWADLQWIRNRWDGKLIVKGIMHPEDALNAALNGADAIIVSNHGGRQLDGAPSSIATLPSILEAVGDKIEVHMDGGIRSGQDVIKALALGARGVYIGRAFLYGLGAMGQEGVFRCLDIIQNELDVTMALCGMTDVKNLDGSILCS